MSGDFQPNNLPPDHDEYVYALEVIAEASATQWGQQTVEEAQIIARNAGLPSSLVQGLGRQSLWNVDTSGSESIFSNYPDYRPFMKTLQLRVPERPIRASDLELSDLVPGARIVSFNDKLINKAKYAKNEVVLSLPFEAENEAGEKYLAIEARRVESHGADKLPLDSDEGKRVVALSSWGIAPASDGLYNAMRYIEPYVNQEVTAQ